MTETKRVIYIFRCADGCTGIAASAIKSKMFDVLREHKKIYGHSGTVSLEDREFIEETYDDISNERASEKTVEFMDEDEEEE
jgi:hypothetical protein